MRSPVAVPELAKLTWREVEVALELARVALVPVGSTEQHGPHMTLETDTAIAEAFARRLGNVLGSGAILCPALPVGQSEHHLAFAGTLTLKAATLMTLVTDVVDSLARHGVKRVLLVNGHGSNVPFLDIAARNITNHSDAICAMASWWSLIPRDLLKELRESEFPGGMAHGCELETSVLLYLRGDLVQFDKAKRDINFQATEFFYWDLSSPSPVFFQEWFSRYSKTGTVGDPTKATREKGEKFVQAVVERMVALLREFRERQIQPRVDHH